MVRWVLQLPTLSSRHHIIPLQASSHGGFRDWTPPPKFVFNLLIKISIFLLVVGNW